MTYCRNLIKKPWAYNPKVVGFIEGTLVKAQGFLIRFLHYEGCQAGSNYVVPQ